MAIRAKLLWILCVGWFHEIIILNNSFPFRMQGQVIVSLLWKESLSIGRKIFRTWLPHHWFNFVLALNIILFWNRYISVWITILYSNLNWGIICWHWSIMCIRHCHGTVCVESLAWSQSVTIIGSLIYASLWCSFFEFVCDFVSEVHVRCCATFVEA